jgi:TonB family protein
MIRLPVAERGFAFALIVSAAIHAALLPMLLSFTTGFATRRIQPMTEIYIEAFLVPGYVAAAGKSALSGCKRQDVVRIAPVVVALAGKVPARVASTERETRNLLADRPASVVVALPQEVQEHFAPVDKEDQNLFTDIRSPAEWLGSGYDTGALPASASPALAVLFPGGVDRSGSNSARIPAARRGSGEFSEGNGAGALAFRREGSEETHQERSGAWPTKDADAVPRYGDNARPAYPPMARLRGYQGVVVLLVEVLVDGRVGQVGIRRSTGHEILDRAALEAVKTWRFEPGRREGRAVTMSVEVPVRFVFNEYSAW